MKQEQTLFSELAKIDTPTICNALDLVRGERSESGFTRRTMIPAHADLSAFIGRARTATLRAVRQENAATNYRWRMEYFRYVSRPGAVVVIEDLDRPAGFGAFWGEVHSTIHAALGLAGVVTNGAVRDLDALSPHLPILAGAITPNHAFVDIEQLNVTVDIFGMLVSPSDIIHADRHGAVVIPDSALAELPAAVECISKREHEILSLAKSKSFSLEKLELVLRRAHNIH